MITKAQCLDAIKMFRTKHAIEAPDENVIAAIHVMNVHAADGNTALDQSSRSGNDNGIDAWYYDDDTNSLFVYQSKLSESKSLTLRGFGDLERAREWVERVICRGDVEVVPDNHCLFNLFRKLSEVRGSVKKIAFVLLSTFNANELEDSIDYQSLESGLGSCELYRVLKERAGRLRVDSSEFDLDKTVPDKVKSYSIDKIPRGRLDLRKNAHLDLAYISLQSLVELYRQRGDVLFDKNVRLSLANNKEARDRLVHPMEETLSAICKGNLSPSIFAFYHIGVTIAASRVAADGETEIDLEAPSIINGCQTVTIANEFLKKLELKKNNDAIDEFKKIKVIAKVVVGTNTDELKEITNSNNRQNPIENWQLFSNESIHIEIESSLKDVGVFYERQKGKFDSVMRNSDNVRHYPSTNGTFVKVVDLAQIIALSRRNLQWAAKPSEIFLNKTNHDLMFDRYVPRNPRDIIFASNLLKALKRGLNNYLEIPAQINSTAPSIFKKAIIRAHFYSIALLHFYQSPNRRSAREEFSVSLTKIANPRLVDEAQNFCQKVVTKTRNWYEEASNGLEVEVAKKRLDAYFETLAGDLGVDFEGATPFSDNTVHW